MLPGLLTQGRAALSLFLNSTGQLRRFTATVDAVRPGDGTWADAGDPFRCSLYSPKGSEVPEGLSLMDRTIYWLTGDIPAATAKDRVVVDGVEYDIHDVPDERTNQFYPKLLVSRLK